MRIVVNLLCAATVLAAAACASSTAPNRSTAPLARPSANPSDLKPAGEATVGDRTRCLTSGEEFTVTADSPKLDYKGKTYYFCCAGCDQKFARDPEKYLSRPGV